MSKKFSSPETRYLIFVQTSDGDLQRLSKGFYDYKDAVGNMETLAKNNPGFTYVLYEAMLTYRGNTVAEKLWSRVTEG